VQSGSLASHSLELTVTDASATIIGVEFASGRRNLHLLHICC
jgi:hypothetical protein